MSSSSTHKAEAEKQKRSRNQNSNYSEADAQPENKNDDDMIYSVKGPAKDRSKEASGLGQTKSFEKPDVKKKTILNTGAGYHISRNAVKGQKSYNTAQQQQNSSLLGTPNYAIPQFSSPRQAGSKMKTTNLSSTSSSKINPGNVNFSTPNSKANSTKAQGLSGAQSERGRMSMTVYQVKNLEGFQAARKMPGNIYDKKSGPKQQDASPVKTSDPEKVRKSKQSIEQKRYTFSKPSNLREKDIYRKVINEENHSESELDDIDEKSPAQVPLQQTRIKEKKVDWVERLKIDSMRRQEQQKLRELAKQIENEERDREAEELSKKKYRSFDRQNFDDFYKEQMEYKQKVENKREEARIMRDKADKDMSSLSRVGLSKESERIYKEKREKDKQRHGSPSIYERLYNTKPAEPRSQSINPQPKKKADPQKVQETITRLVGYQKVQEQNIEKLQQHYKSVWEKSDKDQNKEINDKLVFERLKRDFQDYFDKDLYYQSVDQAARETDNYQVYRFGVLIRDDSRKNLSRKMYHKKTPLPLKIFIRVLFAMGFIPNYLSKLEEELVAELWKMMGGSNEDPVIAENLMIVLAGIMNIQVDEITQSRTESDVKGCEYFWFDDKNKVWFDSREFINKMHLKFMPLCVNRKTKKKEEIAKNQFDFQPAIDPKSRTIADKLPKEKFSLKQIQKEIELEMQRAKIQQFREESEMAECTFQPNLKKELKRPDFGDGATSIYNFKKQQDDEISQPINTHEFSSFISDHNFGAVANIKSQPGFKGSFKPKMNQSQSSQDLSAKEGSKRGQTAKNKFVVNEVTINLGKQSKHNKQHSASRSEHEEGEGQSQEVKQMNSQLKSVRRGSQRPQAKDSEINILQKQWKVDDIDRDSFKSNGSIHSNIDQREDKTPMLVFDIFLGEQRGTKHLLVFEDDQPNVIAGKFKASHGLNEKQASKLQAMLQLKVLNARKKKN